MRQILLAIMVSLSLLTSCTPKQTLGEKETFLSLGTVCAVTLPSGSGKEAYDKVQESIVRVNDTFSRTKEGSELHTLNLNHGGTLSSEAYALTKKAVEMADITGGSFDPAIGGLVSLWGIATDHPRIPTDREIAETDTDWKHIGFGDAKQSVSFPDNLAIDLGGIAKGYAADKAKEAILSLGIKSALVNLGGNVLAVGTKPDGSLWRIGLRDPEKAEGEPFIILQIEDKAVVTSGGYERFFVEDGKTYHHILDRTTGYPAESDLLSASIIGEESTICDALSTAVFVLGSKKGVELVESLPGYAAVVMTKEKEILFSKDFPYQYSII